MVEVERTVYRQHSDFLELWLDSGNVVINNSKATPAGVESEKGMLIVNLG